MAPTCSADRSVVNRVARAAASVGLARLAMARLTRAPPCHARTRVAPTCSVDRSVVNRVANVRLTKPAMARLINVSQQK